MVLPASAEPQTRQRQSFNADWRFFQTERNRTAIPAHERAFDDTSWRTLNLPHDWGVEGPFEQDLPGETGKLPWWGTGWYRKHFTAPKAELGTRFCLDLDGAMSHTEVWLNGVALGGWPYGYSSFRIDLTPALKPGSENVLAVYLNNPELSSRWYPGGGIYRNTWLVTMNPVHVAHWGTFVSTSQVDSSRAQIKIQVQIENYAAEDAQVQCRTEIIRIDSDGNVSGDTVAAAEEVVLDISKGGAGTHEALVELRNPALWTLETRHLYAATTTLSRDGKVVDRYETRFGIRSIEFTSDNGFLLNGQRVQFKGVCLHHDLGALGTAVHTRALERQIQLLQEMGCNAIRTSHNPPAPEFLDLCDRMGILVIVEAFDCWRQAKKPNDYSTLFDKWHERDLRAMIRRDRNHPSVVLWSTGNEVPEQWKGQAVSAELCRIAHDEDPSRMVTAGCNVLEAGYNGFQETVDVFGYNYKPWEYGKFRDANPSLPIYGSETASCISTRGEYFFPVENDIILGRENFQVSSYDLFAPSWGMPPEVEFKGLDQHSFVAGEFVWTGFDYLGEPTPYNADVTNLLNVSDPEARERMRKELETLGKVRVPSRSSYFGIFDLAGFKKDRFYIYQARWRPELPMVHILPHWNWPDRVGQVTPVHVYTSGCEAELFLNGKSLGRKRKGKFEYRLRWDEVKYEPGELKVVSYNNGDSWATETIQTTGTVAQLKVDPDRQEVSADGSDLSFVTVSVADAKGAIVPTDDRRIRFSVTGPGEIVAVDNGDPTSHESFQGKELPTFNGLALVIVRTRAGEQGCITLEARAEGLEPVQASLTSVSNRQ